MAEKALCHGGDLLPFTPAILQGHFSIPPGHSDVPPPPASPLPIPPPGLTRLSCSPFDTLSTPYSLPLLALMGANRSSPAEKRGKKRGRGSRLAYEAKQERKKWREERLPKLPSRASSSTLLTSKEAWGSCATCSTLCWGHTSGFCCGCCSCCLLLLFKLHSHHLGCVFGWL